MVSFWRSEKPSPSTRRTWPSPRSWPPGPRSAIDNARRYTREHAMAVTLQRSLLPRAPARAGGRRGRPPLSARAGRGGRRLVRRHPAARRPGRAGGRRRRRPRPARRGDHGPAAHRGAQLLRPGPAARRTARPPGRAGHPASTSEETADGRRRRASREPPACTPSTTRSPGAAPLARAGHPPPALVHPDGTVDSSTCPSARRWAWAADCPSRRPSSPCPRAPGWSCTPTA